MCAWASVPDALASAIGWPDVWINAMELLVSVVTSSVLAHTATRWSITDLSAYLSFGTSVSGALAQASSVVWNLVGLTGSISPIVCVRRARQCACDGVNCDVACTSGKERFHA